MALFWVKPPHRDGNFHEVSYLRVSGVGKLEDWVNQISCYLELEDLNGTNYTHKVLNSYDEPTTRAKMKILHNLT